MTDLVAIGSAYGLGVFSGALAVQFLVVAAILGAASALLSLREAVR